MSLSELPLFTLEVVVVAAAGAFLAAATAATAVAASEAVAALAALAALATSSEVLSVALEAMVQYQRMATMELKLRHTVMAAAAAAAAAAAGRVTAAGLELTESL